MVSESIRRGAIFAESCERAFALTLSEVIHFGDDVLLGASRSIGAHRLTKEIGNLQLQIESPRHRHFGNPRCSFRLPLAIARFVWFMSASNRLEDIAVYEDRVRFFSDDGVSVPGSSFGHRILAPQPGVNQLASTIELLKRDPSTRRAAIAVYDATDCGRDSRDIPCLIGLLYHIRSGALCATTLMRSNNAFTLLPYNLFELSLLAEVLATELDVPLGTLTHFAASMHVYEDDFARAAGVLESDQPATENRFPAIPATPRPLQQIVNLVQLEAELRRMAATLDDHSLNALIAKAGTTLNDYWRQYFFVLLWFTAVKRNIHGAHSVVAPFIRPPWSLGLTPVAR